MNDIVSGLSKNPTMADEFKKIITELGNNIDVDQIEQVIGDITPLIKVFKSANDLRWKMQLEGFIKGLSLDGEMPEHKIIKLKKYIDNDSKAYFISDLLSKILFSKSKKSCYIIGYLLSELINKEENISVKYIVCADALTELFDHDIDNFKFICKYMNNEAIGINPNKRKSKFISYGKQLNEVLHINNIEKISMVLTLEKLSALQILFKEHEIISDVDFDVESASIDTEECYRMSEVGELLYECIKELKI